MRKTRMATHSTTAFDESEEVRILSGVRSNCGIKEKGAEISAHKHKISEN